MTLWRPNTGQKPGWTDDGAPILHVMVRLRNGAQPPEKWPVDTGRAYTTRWTLTNDAFDIVEWKVA